MTSSKKLAAAAWRFSRCSCGRASEHANVKGMPRVPRDQPEDVQVPGREIDQPLGPTWKNLRTAFIWEDARHDAKLSCLTKRVMGVRRRRRRVAGYAQVKATGAGHTVTATCPNGDIVLGGGNLGGEVAGSYPSSTTSWTIVVPTTTTSRRSPRSRLRGGATVLAGRHRVSTVDRDMSA